MIVAFRLTAAVALATGLYAAAIWAALGWVGAA